MVKVRAKEKVAIDNRRPQTCRTCANTVKTSSTLGQSRSRIEMTLVSSLDVPCACASCSLTERSDNLSFYLNYLPDAD